MACLNMFNNEQQHPSLYNSMSTPRISFSNDFGDPQQPMKKLENNYREAPVSSDFAFAVPSYTMISAADEVFFKGKMLPLRENCTRITTTLKDELLVGHDDDEGEFGGDVATRFGKGMSSWKEKLGLKRAPLVVVPKKCDKAATTTTTTTADEMKRQDGVCAGSKGSF